MPVGTTEPPGGATAYNAPHGGNIYADFMGQLVRYIPLAKLALLHQACKAIWATNGKGRITLVFCDKRCLRVELTQEIEPE